MAIRLRISRTVLRNGAKAFTDKTIPHMASLIYLSPVQSLDDLKLVIESSLRWSLANAENPEWRVQIFFTSQPSYLGIKKKLHYFRAHCVPEPISVGAKESSGILSFEPLYICYLCSAP